MLYYIYKHTNKINGKVYIGQTKQALSQRWRKDGSKYKGSTKFYNAIQKYGWDNFDHSVICQCEEWEVDILEKAFIDKYDSINNGYNLDSGGHENKQHAESTKKKISRTLSRTIICEELNKEFYGANEAARQLGIHNSLIVRCCNGKIKTAHGMHFRYKEVI